MSERVLLSEKEMLQCLESMAREILDRGLSDAALVGIRSRGVPLARLIAGFMEKKMGKQPKVGSLDINLYRDDLSEVSEQAILHNTEIPFRIDGEGIILIDDVLYTGRTVRAAMDALIDLGRPKFIMLAALVDRGWREFPIQGDFIGMTVETKADEVVKVMTKDCDGKNEVILKSNFSKRK